MKRFKSTKKNKNGVILVVVLLVLAVAMIFITSALMLTNATRNRTYDRATESQARLTVTSLSEAFYRSVQMQEITDDDLWNYAGTKGSPNRINVTNSSGDVIPGLSNSADNQSYIEIERATAKSSIDDVKVSFTTVIDGKTERVREYYKYAPKAVIPNFFRAQVDLIGKSNDVFNLDIGAGAPAGADDNWVIVRGSDVKSSSGGTDMDSNFMFLGNTTVKPLDNNYRGDMIFLNGSKLDWKTNGNFKGDVMFLGKSKSSATDAFVNVDSSSKAWGNGNKWVFVNRYSNNADRVEAMLTSGGKKIVAASGAVGSLSYDGSMIKTSGAKTSAESYTKGDGKDLIKSGGLVDQYLKADTVDAGDSSSGKYAESVAYPKASAAFAKEGLDMTAPSGTDSYSISSFDSTFNGQDVPAGTYEITGNGKLNTNPDGGFHYYFLSGSLDYIFYIDGKLNLTGAAFVVLNPGSGTAKFILTSGSQIWINNTANKQDEHYSCNGSSDKFNSGFISSSNYSAPATKEEWLASWTGKIKSISYGTTKTPTIYIYGVGSNKVCCSRYGSLEAFVGLFDDDYTTSTSEVWFSGDDVHFYGRIMTPKLSVYNSASVHLPYCPAPGEGKKEKLELQESRYSVTSFQYYY